MEILNTKNKSQYNIYEEYDLTVQNIDMELKKVIIMDDNFSEDQAEADSNSKSSDETSSDDSDESKNTEISNEEDSQIIGDSDKEEENSNDSDDSEGTSE